MSFKVVSIGEILWDVFPDERRPGGAPCNVAYHACRLGDEGAIVSRIGNDEDGEHLLTFLEEQGVDTTGVQRDPDYPTGTVGVTFVGKEPQYQIAENVAWDYLAETDEVVSLLSGADAVCFGSLVQRSPKSRHTVHELLRGAKKETLIVFDANLRPPFVDAQVIESSLRMSDVVKMSDSEVATVSRLLGKNDLVKWLIHEVGVDSVCTTSGGDGAHITTADGAISASAVPVDTGPGDFVGVGDAFIAALTHKLIRDTDTTSSLQFANRYAALVATRRGAMPKLSTDDLARVADSQSTLR